MQERHLEIGDFEEFVTLMSGQIFHATTQENYGSIVSDGGLKANVSGEKDSVYGNSNGFFRLRGCVSFFDYRKLSDSKVKQHLYKCIPTRIAEKHEAMVVLVLSPDAYTNLESWTSWQQEQAYSQKVVPRIEIGYPKFVPLNLISEVLTVSIVS